MRTKLYAGVAFAALMIPASAFAQSTGSTEVEEIVVTGSGDTDIGGVQIPDSPKARAVLTQDFIERRTPGQSIVDTVNLVPGVNFTNSDPYGGSGGNLRIRGFDGNRISYTFDGFPTNDSGNYALYPQQSLDPELIEQVNVNFGATDVDSPTASASGGTINYRSMNPRDELGAAVTYSHGTNDMNRVFGVLHTGILTSFGTKAWISASDQQYDQFRGPGRIKRTQFNGKIYQPLGNNGDFFSVAGHYNEGRNNFYSNPSLGNLRTVLGSSVIPSNPAAGAAPNAANPFTLDLTDAQYDAVFDNARSAYLYDRSCVLPSATGVNGTRQDDRAACHNVASVANNPGNTGNIRFNSRYTLGEKLTLTVDGMYQYVKANGGGSAVFSEANSGSNVGAPTPAANPLDAGYSSIYNRQYERVGAGIAAGADLNGDGDTLDYVRAYFPSNTRTQRLAAIVGLRYDIDDSNLIRVAYAWDRARHRQTGEASRLRPDGSPYNVFSSVNGEDFGLRDAAGNQIQKRNRLSYAILHQISGEYRGSFVDDALKVAIGVRAPFLRRNLNNYCYTIAGSGTDAYCTSQTAAQVAANTTTAAFGAPYEKRIKSYNAVLPNVGATFAFTPEVSAFGSYAKGFSAPRTDNLYAFDDVKIAPTEDVKPEKTDSFDLGLRYTSRLVQAQVAGWYIKYQNRIISSTVTLEGGGTLNIDRNVGTTETKGVDASLSIRPSRHLSLYGFVSYIDSELKDDAVNPVTGAVIAATKGKAVVETPEWQYGGRIQFDLEPISVGVQAKHVGDRFVTDVNDLESKGYTLVDLDARLDLATIGLRRTYLQVNVSNLLNEKYFGNLTTVTDYTGSSRFAFGAPRTVIGSIHFEF